MSNLPLFWPLVASALLRMGSIVTCRPSAANSPSFCAMYRPALSATGTAPTVRFVFSRPDTFGGALLLLGLLHPAPTMIRQPPVRRNVIFVTYEHMPCKTTGRVSPVRPEL